VNRPIGCAGPLDSVGQFKDASNERRRRRLPPPPPRPHATFHRQLACDCELSCKLCANVHAIACKHLRSGPLGHTNTTFSGPNVVTSSCEPPLALFSSSIDAPICLFSPFELCGRSQLAATPFLCLERQMSSASPPLLLTQAIPIQCRSRTQECARK
jgi:hypothetical protein